MHVKRSVLLVVAVLSLMFTLGRRPAEGDPNWSPWQRFNGGAPVSVSFTQVNRDTWTWKFRNDGARPIVLLKFQYTDRDGTHADILPGDLQPGQVFGGWAAFTASSSPTIRLTQINYR